MSVPLREIAAEKFAKEWEGEWSEDGYKHKFWIELLRDVYNVENVKDYIKFEEKVKIGTTKSIDGLIKDTKVIIEHKSSHIDLDKKEYRGNGEYQTPLEQACNYIGGLDRDDLPNWIITSNFKTIRIYDIRNVQINDITKGDPEKLKCHTLELKNLKKEYDRLEFLVNKKKVSVEKKESTSVKAAKLIGTIYDALLEQYKDKDNPNSLKSLNILCVRIVFCLYAENSGVFPQKGQFHDYLYQYPTKHIRDALEKLFTVLNQDGDAGERNKYLEEDLANFPYVNGGLFAEDIEIPSFTDNIRDLILEKSSDKIDWSDINPTIFGALFESTLNQKTRRTQGMHYTSIENIHKVIDPLFLNSLREELERIKTVSNESSRNKQFDLFREKLSNLSFLDPACGSGNFLTETYLSLRRMENEILKLQQKKGQILFDVDGVIKVNINQFYGIEYNDFAVSVAKTALWIAESQMMKETEKIVASDLKFLPLKTNVNIIEANALQIDWERVVPKDKLSYIIGNPPFVGYKYQTEEQKKDIISVFVDKSGKPYKASGKIDYVSGWYYKAASMMKNSSISTAFVSTNSITQGDQVGFIWKPLYELFDISIIFAHRTFKWGNEARDSAAVHCVIIGFNTKKNNTCIKYIFNEDGKAESAVNINPYLVDAPNIIVESRSKPLCKIPEIIAGNRATDDGNLILSADEKDNLIKQEPLSAKYIKRYMMGREFINNIDRYCLWLVDCPPEDLKKMPLVLERVKKVKSFRENSTKKSTREKSLTPTLFDEIKSNNSDFIAIPFVSSEKREYIPIGYLDKNVIAGDGGLFMIPGASLYHFGILTSRVHMAWMRAIAGRLEMRYRYSKDVVYNNFPWPNPTDEQITKVEELAKNILDIRLENPKSTLADLYDSVRMPPALREAHKKLDSYVEKIYGIKDNEETKIVSFLLEKYKELSEKQN